MKINNKLLNNLEMELRTKIWRWSHFFVGVGHVLSGIMTHLLSLAVSATIT